MSVGIDWAPQLPQDWKHSRLRWISEIYAGGTPDRANLDYWTDGTIPWVNSGSVNDWTIASPSDYITAAGFANSSARMVPPRSVVIALAGQGKTKGTSARLEIETTTNQSMAAIVPVSTLDYRFLHYWLASNYQSIRNLAGGDLRDGLNLQHISGIEVPLPELRVQVEIADYLDHETSEIDTLIAKQETMMQLLLERRGSEIDEALDQYSSEVVPLRRVASVEDCAHVTAEFVDDDASYPVASIRECQGTSVDLSSCRFTTREYFDLLRSNGRSPRPGDLLFIRNVSVGLVSIVATDTPPFAMGQETVLIRPTATNSPEFLRYALTSSRVRSAIEDSMIGSTFRRINVSAIRSLPVHSVPLKTQLAIVTRLDAETAKIDALVAKAEQFIALSKERRAALITAAVTGQLEIPGVAA